MIKAIIVDDELKARKNLLLLIQQLKSNDIEIIAEADNVEDAYHLINEIKPDLIFLDIEMGQQAGFDLIARFSQPTFKCIFITAYDQYALKAIKFCALDYLLKPVDATELELAIAKAKNVIGNVEKENMQNLVSILKNPFHKANKVSIPTSNGFTLVPVQNIMYLEANEKYTYLYCVDGQKICSTTGLGTYEELLSDYTFFRAHHSYIINKEFITSYIKGDGGEVVLKNKTTITVSKRRKTAFLQWLEI